MSTVPKTLFRCEGFSGSGIRNLLEIISFEVTELRNRDIFQYVLSHYALPDHVRADIEAILGLDDDAYPFTSERSTLEITISEMIEEIGKASGKTLRYGLWLAARDIVNTHYGGTVFVVDEYPTSDVILSDLGPDGLLFAYEDRPRPTAFHSRSDKPISR